MSTVRAYGPEHRARRAELLAYVAMHPGEVECAICHGTRGPAFDISMGARIHLHHSSPDAKKAGLPGDVLAHAWCNERERAVPPQVRAKVAPGMVARTPGCRHPGDWAASAGGCKCADPVRHHARLSLAARDKGDAVQVNHYARCPSCTGYGGRLW